MARTAKDLFVGIDAGTTGSKVALFDSCGNEIGSGYCEYPCIHPHSGWVEQDIEEVWKGICRASRIARIAANVADDAIRSLGLSSQRGSFILLDEQEHPLAPAVLWNDSRAKQMERVIMQRISPERYRQITGMPVSGSWAISKLVWLLHNRHDLMERARYICNGQEYFLRRLGADALESDPSALTLNGMLDIRKLDWSEEVCQAAGIDLARLPPVGRPGTMVGRLSKAAADETELPAGIAVCRGGGDQQCAAVGAGIIKQGLAEVTIGTSAMMVAHLEDPGLVMGPAPYIGGHAVAGKWDAEGGAFSIGSCLKWWRDNFGQTERNRAELEGTNVYEILIASAATAPVGSRGIIFQPFFAGQVTPYYDTTARGAFLGLGLDHDRSCLLRAMLEGCACEVRFMVDGVARDLEGGISELRVTGGASRSDQFIQMHADILRRPLVLLHNRECTVLGASILGAVGSGYFANIDEAVQAMVAVGRTVEPDPSTAEIYSRLFELFRFCYETAAQAGLYEAVYEFQRKYF